jgi:flagellar hook assembly protein FlgD
LRGNTPNPFNPATTISFDVAEKARVEMRIYDVRGRLVCQLLSAELEPGSHTIVWDGKTTARQPLASSVYFLHMQAGSVSMSRRLILLR